jgi:hypothetical protein
MTLLTPHPPVITAAVALEVTGPVGRFVHIALALIADENGHVETTVHTLQHMTGMPKISIEAALGFNSLDKPLFPATVSLVDGVVTADLPTGA